MKTKNSRNKKWVSLIKTFYWYINVFEPSHPLSRKNWYVALHRKVAFDGGKFSHIKESDYHKYEVHHDDEDKENNALSNLIVLPKWEHSSLHHKWAKRPRKNSFTCIIAWCGCITSSKYWLCTKCYRSQWSKIKNGGNKFIIPIYEKPDLLSN